MKPPPFAYHRARSAGDALRMLEECGDEGRVLAGGQSLVPLMNFRLARPVHLVDVSPIDELGYVRRANGELAIGACARQSAVERSRDAAEMAPLLVEALGWVGHEPIRHRGTVVGSLAHADPAAELPAVALAMDARVVVASAGGQREVEAPAFFTGPFTTALRPGEMALEVRFPLWPDGTGHAFMEFARRHGDFAIAGAGTLLALDGGRITRVAIALCGVAPIPVRARRAEELLMGRSPDPELLESAAQAAVADLQPSGDLHGGSHYRRSVARAYVRRALSQATERAGGGSR
jgi:aerobic carbon-monoxide dehydrogenase medium subunit